MSRFVTLSLVCALILGFAGATSGAETKEEKLTADETQAQYQRKSMTYLGITQGSGVGVPEENLRLIEQAIRKQIELKRFDYNAVDLGSAYSIDQFVAELREYVKKRSVDRASAEAEYEARFKRARVLASDIDRIMNSAYFYVIQVVLFQTQPFTCPWDAKQAAAQKCVPGSAGIKATVDATATFYRANLTDDSKPAYEVLKTVRHVPVDASDSYESPPKPPPSGATDAVVRAYRQALADYNRRLPELQKQAGLTATAQAAGGLALWLSKEMKKIPEFQLKTPVTAALSDGVEFMLGKDVGLGLDDTYDVTEFDVAGRKSTLGYVKVRNVGEAQGTGEGTPSYAEKVKEKRGFVGGEQLYEHPMIGLAVGVHGVFEMVVKDLMGKDQIGFYPGVGLYADYDLANMVKWPEFYFSLESDILFLGDDESGDWNYKLVHGMIGFKKKWYATSLVFTVGLRAGISYYLITYNGDLDQEYQGDTIGFGGDLVAGLEYYIIPEFSVYLKAAGRFFTNPVDIGTGVEFDPEMGANVSLGAFLAF